MGVPEIGSVSFDSSLAGQASAAALLVNVAITCKFDDVIVIEDRHIHTLSLSDLPTLKIIV